MKNLFSLKLCFLACCLITLAACGTFEIHIEVAPTHYDGPAPAITTQEGAPTPSLETTSVVKTDTPAPPTFQPDVAPTLPTPTAGSSLKPLQPGTPLKIVRTGMLDAQQGWAVGQVDSDLHEHILFTHDSGRTWQDRTPLPALEDAPAEGLQASAYFASPSRAWVAYSGRPPQAPPLHISIWRTSDGGASWRASSPLLLGDLPTASVLFSQLGFLDERNGWLMIHLLTGESKDQRVDTIAIFTTTDEGQSWQRVVDLQSHPQLMDCVKTDLVFTTASQGWLTGNCQGDTPSLFFYTTSDGGKSWKPVDLPPPQGKPEDFFTAGVADCGLSEVVFASPRSLLSQVVCTSSQTNLGQSWLYSSGDSGLNWATLPLPAPYGAFDFINRDEGWYIGSQNVVQGGAGIYHTTDGGRTWSILTPTGWIGQPDFADTLNGWVVARQERLTALVRSNDRGITWEELRPSIAK